MLLLCVLCVLCEARVNGVSRVDVDEIAGRGVPDVAGGGRVITRRPLREEVLRADRPAVEMAPVRSEVRLLTGSFPALLELHSAEPSISCGTNWLKRPWPSPAHLSGRQAG